MDEITGDLRYVERGEIAKIGLFLHLNRYLYGISCSACSGPGHRFRIKHLLALPAPSRLNEVYLKPCVKS
jgi:hypothetical protein